MTTINLQQEQREQMVNGAGKMNSSLIFFLVICVIFALIFGGLKIASSIVSGKNLKVKAQIEAANATLNEKKNVDDVLDLQMRLKEIKSSLSSKVEVNGILDKISNTVMPGIVFTSYRNSGKKVALTLRASNFDTISKQIFNFKQSDFASDVVVTGLSREESKIDCSVEMNIK
jgi:hypothetical protein